LSVRRRFAKQSIGGDAAIVDQRLTAAHRFKGAGLALRGLELGKVEEGDLEAGDDLFLKGAAAFPEELHEGADLIALGRLAKGIEGDASRLSIAVGTG
jgi:hypothetical protein